MTQPHYDDLETRDPLARERAQFAALAALIERARAQAPALAEHLAGVDARALTGRAALARLPVLRKSELIERQKRDFAERAPFGGLTTVKTGALARIFASPGPIYDPEGHGRDWWRTARALYAAGFRRGDVVHNTFSYHLTPAGSMLESGAHALGCAVIPAGVGNTELQVRTIADVRPRGYVGTPSFLKIILDKAKELGADVSSLGLALVSGEALPNALRAELAERGVAVVQCYATADVGLIGYESLPGEGLIVDEGVIVEVVRPGTGDPVADGETGEVVVSALNADYPLIRFATGDLSQIMPGVSRCGRTNARLRGWMGRADQTTKVKGMFVHPAQVAEVLRRHGLARGRLVVDRDGTNDVMTLRVEGTGDSAQAAAIAETVQAVTKLRGAVAFVAPGSLPNDGKVIEDVRKHD
ncbi:MAG: AMP-binding protein [Alphaproteobacteria bacterium]|nr:AMP-binding protein [Alphaproteobacteria bacterium]